jgi:hypothetical protein
MSKDPENISAVLKKFIKGNKLEQGIDNVRIKELWTEHMGNGVANYTQNVQLSNSTLFISLSSAVLREELSYGKSKIISMMNDALGKELITKVVLR